MKKGSKILIANDSVGLTGVQTYVQNIRANLEKRGYEVEVIQPSDKEFIKVSPPMYKDFNWTLFAMPIITERVLSFRPDAILVTTVEGPIGKATKDVCEFLEISKMCKSCDYTLSYTTDIERYLQKIYKKSPISGIGSRVAKDLPEKVIKYSEAQFTKSRYRGARRVLVNAHSSKERLEKIGVKNIAVSHRGIDKEMYKLANEQDPNPYMQYDWYKDNQLPVLLYLGRVAYEKDIDLFLEGDYPKYHRVVIGDGPAMEYLKDYSKGKENVHFLGAIEREETPPYYQFARVSFFPSSFDTFGNTIIESCACGTPVIGFNVQGPKDVIKSGIMGIIVKKGKSLFDGLDMALGLDREYCSRYTQENFSWEKATDELLNNLYQIKWSKTLA